MTTRTLSDTIKHILPEGGWLFEELFSTEEAAREYCQNVGKYNSEKVFEVRPYFVRIISSNPATMCVTVYKKKSG